MYYKLQENGAAYEAGGLEVGQLILEVDGQKVEGIHQLVIVFECYKKYTHIIYMHNNLNAELTSIKISVFTITYRIFHLKSVFYYQFTFYLFLFSYPYFLNTNLICSFKKLLLTITLILLVSYLNYLKKKQ